MCVPVGYMEELVSSVGVIEFAREWGEDELVGVAPNVSKSVSRDACSSFSERVWWGVV